MCSFSIGQDSVDGGVWSIFVSDVGEMFRCEQKERRRK